MHDSAVNYVSAIGKAEPVSVCYLWFLQVKIFPH
jgi:hypothetical protein